MGVGEVVAKRQIWSTVSDAAVLGSTIAAWRIVAGRC